MNMSLFPVPQRQKNRFRISCPETVRSACKLLSPNLQRRPSMIRNLKLSTIVCLIVMMGSVCEAQQRQQPNAQQSKRRSMDVPDNPQEIGESGIAWYTTWKSGLAEAKRSNRPIFFMSAATTCNGVSGVF